MTIVRKSVQGGFSLIEMVLSISLLAILLPFLMLFVVTIAELWMQGTEGDFFPEHIDGVTQFLEHALERSEAVLPPGDGSGPSLPVEWARPPGFSDLDDPLLMFRQRETPVLLTRDGSPRPNLNAYLYFSDEDGLSLLWYSDHDEEVEDRNDLFRTEISPYVSSMSYAYYDADFDRWEIVEDPEEGDGGVFILPQYLKLTFTYAGESVERNLFLPQRNPDVPTF